MSPRKNRIRLVGAFAALASLALAVSCRGFFVNPTLTSLAIGPANLSLAPKQAFQMVATGTYDDGSTKTVTGQCVWTSSDSAVANFSATVIGQLVAGPLSAIPNPPGTTNVSASLGTVASSTQAVNVCPVVETLTVEVNGGSSVSGAGGTTYAFTASATFNGVTGKQDVTSSVSWNISNPSVLSSITAGSGTTNTSSPGTTSVSASLCNVTSSNSVTVTNTD